MMLMRRLLPALLLAVAVSACPDPFTAEEDAQRLEEEDSQPYVQSVSPASVMVEVGETRDVSVAIAGDDVPNSVNVVSADASIATATAQTGASRTRTATIAGLAVGQTSIRFSLNGNSSASRPAPAVQVTVVAPAVNLTIAPEQWQMNVGETVQLACIATLVRTGLPTTGEPLTWSTSDAAVASVDASGAVAAVGVGTAGITCMSSSGATATATIVVTPVSLLPTHAQIPGSYALTAQKSSDTCPEGLFPTAVTNPGNIAVQFAGTAGNPPIAFGSTATVIGVYNAQTGAYSGSGTTTVTLGQTSYQLTEIISGVWSITTTAGTGQTEIRLNGQLLYEATPAGGSACVVEYAATWFRPFSF